MLACYVPFPASLICIMDRYSCSCCCSHVSHPLHHVDAVIVMQSGRQPAGPSFSHSCQPSSISDVGQACRCRASPSMPRPRQVSWGVDVCGALRRAAESPWAPNPMYARWILVSSHLTCPRRRDVRPEAAQSRRKGHVHCTGIQGAQAANHASCPRGGDPGRRCPRQDRSARCDVLQDHVHRTGMASAQVDVPSMPMAWQVTATPASLSPSPAQNWRVA